jgi:hypothetical protein
MEMRIVRALLAASAILLTISLGAALTSLYNPTSDVTTPPLLFLLANVIRVIAPYVLFATGLVALGIALWRQEWRWAGVLALTLLVFIAAPLLLAFLLGPGGRLQATADHWSPIAYGTLVYGVWYGATLPLLLATWQFLERHNQQTPQQATHALT